jgi:transcriptional regulator with PAS, ATPase and Fis domain
MKKIIIELLRKHFDFIKDNWIHSLSRIYDKKLSQSQISVFVENTLKAIIDISEKSDYSSVDNYIIQIFYLFEHTNLNFLEISRLYNNGRSSIMHVISREKKSDYDPVVVIEYIEEIIEQIFTRYSMLRQEVQMKELSLDRDRLALKLEINQQYLKNILHTSDSAIMVIDQNEKFIAWNKGAENIFGFTLPFCYPMMKNLIKS